MSLILSRSHPKIEIKTWGHIAGNNKVHLGDYEIPMSDFCEAIYYALTNTDLFPDDPRLKLVEEIKRLIVLDGYADGEKRLGYDSRVAASSERSATA
jgi:hypothetical protein